MNPMPPTVVHLVISLAPGGLERLVVDWTNQRNRRYPGSTMVCCLDERGALADQVEGGAVVCLNAVRSRKPFDFTAVRRLRQFLTQNELRRCQSRPSVSTTQQLNNLTTVLHSHNAAAWQYGVLACLGQGIRHIHTEHGTNPHSRGFINRFRNALLWRLTDQLVVVADAVAGAICVDQGIPRRRIAVIANGVASRRRGAQAGEDAGPMEASVDKKGGWGHPPHNEGGAKMWGGCPHPPAPLVIGSVGRLAYVKGYDRLITAFSGLVNSHRYILVLVGEGPERAVLERQASDLGVADRVQFVGYQPDPNSWYGRMDLFVLPSRSEGLSVSLLEAMTAGVPVVVTDVGENRMVLDNGRCGILLPEDETQWPGILTSAIADPGIPERIAAAQDRVRTCYSLDKTLEEYEKLYGDRRVGTPAPQHPPNEIMLITISNLFPRPDQPNRGLYNLYLFREMERMVSGYLNICLVPEWRIWRWPSIRRWREPISSREDAKIAKEEMDACIEGAEGSSLLAASRLRVKHTPSTVYVPVFYLPVIGRAINWAFYRIALNQLIKALSSKSTISNQKSSIVYYIPWLDPDGVAVAEAIRGSRARLWLMALGSDTFHLRSPVRRRRILAACRDAEGIVCVANVLADRLAAAGVPHEKLYVVPNGVDVSLFRAREKSELSSGEASGNSSTLRRTAIPCHAGQATQQPNNLTTDMRTILFVGNLVPVKAPDILLEAFGLLARMHQQAGGVQSSSPNFAPAHPPHTTETGARDAETPLWGGCHHPPNILLSLVIIGDGLMRNTLERKACEMGIADHVHFLGRRSPAEVAEWMNAADVLCLPSRSEGMPNVVLEARACGLPVVATPAGAIPEIPLAKEHFLVTRDFSTQAIADGLREMLSRDLSSRHPDPAIPTWQSQARKVLNTIGLSCCA